jgi:hypothetical protein
MWLPVLFVVTFSECLAVPEIVSRLDFINCYKG